MASPNVFKAVALAAGTTNAALWTPATGKKFRLMGGQLSYHSTGIVTLLDGSTTALGYAFMGNTAAPVPLGDLGQGILSAAADNVLSCARSVSATITGTVWGTEEG